MKLLIPDDTVAKTFKFDDYVCLFSSFENKVPWSLTIDDYFKFNSAVTKFSDELTNYLINIDFLNIDANDLALNRIIRPTVGLLSYIIFYRLIRLNKLTQFINAEDLVLAEANSFEIINDKFELYALTRDSWEFNQFLINNLMSCHNCKVLKINKESESWDFRNWTFYEGYQSAIRKSTNQPDFVKNIYHRLKDYISPLKWELENFNPINRIPMGLIAFHEPFFYSNGFMNEDGGFQSIKNNFVRPYFKNARNKKFRESIIEMTSGYFNDLLYDKFSEFELNNRFKHSKNITKLFFDLYPVSRLEKANYLFKKCTRILSKFQIKHYFSSFPSATETEIFLNSAATNLGFKTWGVQHSARGGYFANDPIIAEENISGTDYYITSGWDHPEPHLPFWKVKALPIASPAYSEMKKLFKINQVNNNTVLIALGEIFQYPVIHDGSYYIDTRKEWVKYFDKLIKNLTENNIHVLIRCYCNISSVVLKNILKKWEDDYGNKLDILDDYEKGKARELFDKVTATIWDVPAGGFVESLLHGTPAFSIASPDLMRFQPEADDYINALKSAGVLAERPEIMAKSVISALNGGWWNNIERKTAVDEFLDKFIVTNYNWQGEWRNKLSEISFTS
jgi:putative transferase (TIGR04331 family)